MHESEISGNVWESIKCQILTECSNMYNLCNKTKQPHFKLTKNQIFKKKISAKGYTQKKLLAKALS